jgi:tetratricopeptide (TPR) repeat protein
MRPRHELMSVTACLLLAALLASPAAAGLDRKGQDQALANMDAGVRLPDAWIALRGNVYRKKRWARRPATQSWVSPADRKDCNLLLADKDAAIAACTRAISSRMLKGQELAEVYNIRGSIHRSHKGDHERAIADFSRAIRLVPTEARLYVERGFLYFNAKDDPDRAVADFGRAIRLDPRSFDEAIADLSDEIRADPSNPSAWFYRGSVYYWKKEDDERAIADFSEALRLRPDAAVYTLRGRSYERNGQIKEALADFRAALSHSPNHRSAKKGFHRLVGQIATSTPPSRPAQAPAETPSVGFARPSSAQTAAAANPVTVRQLFEKFGLLGFFAADCSVPVSEQNPFIVHRASGDYVQRDSMSSARTRVDAHIIDSASEGGPGEIVLSMANDRGRMDSVLRMESGRWRLVEARDANGEQVIAGGRLTANGAEMAWLAKCQ